MNTEIKYSKFKAQNSANILNLEYGILNYINEQTTTKYYSHV